MQTLWARVRQGWQACRAWLQGLLASRSSAWLASAQQAWRQKSWPLRLTVGVLLALVLVLSALGLYWSQFPKPVNVVLLAEQRAQQQGVTPVRGWTLSHALYHSMDTLLTKPGGFIRNDVSPPGILMDDMPNWERGVVFMARDLARAMRRDFSRSQAQSLDDPNLRELEPLFNISMDSWMFPRAESEYRAGLSYLDSYMLALTDGEQQQAQFYARADNLARWLADVESRLGSLSLRLSASVGQPQWVTGLTGDAQASQSTSAGPEIVSRTPWHQIDDVYFETRGSAWALLLYLRAVEVEFADVLQRRNAMPALQQVIAELEMTQRRLRVPMVMNGSGVGIWPNHSLVMANYVSRAQLGIRELQDMLIRG